MASRSVEQLRCSVGAVLGEDPHGQPDCLVLEDTEVLLAVQRQLDGALAARLQVIDARDATTSERGRCTRGWLVEELQLSGPDARGRLRVARAGVARPAVIEALRGGEIGHDHAKVILNFLPKLPDADAKDHAEKLLLDAAKVTDPTTMTRGLRELADRLCLNETAEQRAARRHADRWLRFTETFNGMTRFDGMLDPVQATIVQTALAPLSQRAGEHDDRTIGQRRADALVDLATMAMNRGDLPDTAGEPTQLVVQTFLADLTRRLQAGDTCHSTLGGTPITPNTVRMLACDAGIIPAVMGGPSEVLDLGRSTRTWSRAQRKAAKLRANNHCEAPLCQAAIERCQLHHEQQWAEHHGPTDLDNGIYLCTYHHRLTHHTPWTITRNHAGRVEIRRT
ncbi:MAG TPA: DUF222 domain-containing protein [Mycobacteriales bacterium]|jgi:hypothetical protein|nr:DUF222 domain-containing protein [Mycobacteriales bacterium]